MLGFLKKLSGGKDTAKKQPKDETPKQLIIKPSKGLDKDTGGDKKVATKSLRIGNPNRNKTEVTLPSANIEENKQSKPEDDDLFTPKNENNNLDIQSEHTITIDSILDTVGAMASGNPMEEEVATIFSEGEDQAAIQAIKNYLKENKGTETLRLWFMLLDLYQINGNSAAFDKVALAFAHTFGTSPPSWFGSRPSENAPSTIANGKNMIILEPVLDSSYTEKFRELLKSAKQENFCRINVSQCKFEQNSPEMIDKFLKLLTDLKRNKIVSILMGDNNLFNFCKKFIDDEGFRKNLSPELLNREQIVWLLYLEVLQWKGQSEEFEKIALSYAEQFEVSPPGWDDNGVMDLSKLSKEHLDNVVPTLELEKKLNSNNITPLLDYITSQFEKGENAEIDLSMVDRIDFNAAGSISFHIQGLWINPAYKKRKVTLLNPNELIIILLHMVGTSEFVKIVPRNRS